jgi:hypothetical protein
MTNEGMAIIFAITVLALVTIKYWREVLLLFLTLTVAIFVAGVYQVAHAVNG